MTTLFRLDGSVRPQQSDSRRLADLVESATREGEPGIDVVRRDLGSAPIPATAWADALGAAMTPADDRTTDQRAAHGFADGLATELQEADGFLFAAPLYNWGVSQYVKTWADVVMATGRLGPRGSVVAGRPAVLVVTRGGDYREGSGHPEWDWATGWLRRVFQDVWGLELEVVELHLTLAPFREYLAHLRGEAAEELVRAEQAATEAGHRLAERLAR